MKPSSVKFIAIACIAFVTLHLNAEAKEKSKGERLKNVIYKRTGGQIVKPGSQQGIAGVINLQKKFDVSNVNSALQNIAKATKFNFSIACDSGKIVDTANANKVRMDFGFNVAVFVVDSPSDPNAILMNQDAGWAIVNVANIKGANVDRIAKIITRALLGVCGGASTQYDGTLISPISKYEDLDALSLSDIPLDALSRFNKALPTKGMSPAYIRSYKAACEEGWAPAPTNEIQKAIWDKVHAMPTAPIKIKPETKKVTE